MSTQIKKESKTDSPSKSPPPPGSDGSKFPSTDPVTTTDIIRNFFPLFYSGERGALGIWEKETGLGHIKRRIEDNNSGADHRSRKYQHHVLELVNPHSNTGTYITAPRGEWQALHLTLQHLVMIVKNFRRNFCFEILILDNKGSRRRFCFATWFNPLNLKKYPFLCQVPLKLEMGWNEIHVNLDELTRSMYKTKYVETIRIQVNANCRLRQIFFCDDEIISGQLPVPSMKSFQNMRFLPQEFGPLNHPDYLETGPEKKREHIIPDPPTHPALSRIERDLKIIRKLRFDTIVGTKQIHHYKSYFRDLLADKHKYLKEARSSLTSAGSTDSKKDTIEGPPNSYPIPPGSSVLWDDNDQNPPLQEENSIEVEVESTPGEETDPENKGVPIPLDLGNKRSVNLMDIVNRGRSKDKKTRPTSSRNNTQDAEGRSRIVSFETPTGPSTAPATSTKTEKEVKIFTPKVAWGQNEGKYDPPAGRPPSKSPERPPFYFRPATPFPPPSA